MTTDVVPRTHWFDTVTSTQDVLHELAAQGAPSGSAVVAREQSAARGSRGRVWHSPPGGVWLSVLYRPGSRAGLEVASLRIGLAAAAALEAASGVGRMGLKWPNDLMVGDSKVGGVLCETRWQGGDPAWVTAGIGLNVANDPPADTRLQATRLGGYRADADPESLIEALIEALVGVLRRVDITGSTLSPAELADFTARDWLRGRRLQEPAEGVAQGIAADGALRVGGDSGTVMVRSGSVVLA